MKFVLKIAMLVIFITGCRAPEIRARQIANDKAIWQKLIEEEKTTAVGTDAFLQEASTLAKKAGVSWEVVPDPEGDGIALYQPTKPWVWYEVYSREGGDRAYLVRMRYSFPRGEAFAAVAQSEEDWVWNNYTPTEAVVRVIEELSLR